MNLSFEIIRYVVFIIIGIILISWYMQKKGRECAIKRMLSFIIGWKTVMLFVLIGTDILIESLWRLDIYYYYSEVVTFPIIMVIIAFVINILLGIAFFEIIFKQKMQEIIIIIIVLIELILDNSILYLLSRVI